MIRNKEAKVLLELAKRDKAAFEVLIKSKGVSLSVACFHAQQVAEKSLKAVLASKGVPFKRTHDLVELYSLLVQNKIEVTFEPEFLSRLNPYAVTFRYDDTEIELVSRNEVKRFVALVYEWAKKLVSSMH